MYRDSKYLSITDQAQILDAESIDIPTEVANSDHADYTSEIYGEIIGVLNTDEYLSCLACKAKVNQISDKIGQCHKCNLQMKLTMCEVFQSAHVIFRSTDKAQQHKVKLFQKDLQFLTSNATGTNLTEKLLNTSPVKLSIDAKDIAHVINFSYM